MPVKLGPGKNPLRDAGDRRLNRIAGPSGLIIFGVTGAGLLAAYIAARDA